MLPTVRLESFFSNSQSERADFIQTLGSSMEKFGYVKFSSEGLLPSEVNKGYEISRQFFNLGAQRKLDFANPDAKGLWGYLKIPSFERYNFEELELWVTNDDPESHWPEELFEFKSYTKQLYQKFETCALTCLKACALYLDLPEAALASLVTDGWSMLRYFRYVLPSTLEIKNKEEALFVEHQDKTLISILTPGDIPGLELKLGEPDWHLISGEKDGLILAGGDMINYFSGGILKGGVHRVVSGSRVAKDRVTMLFSSVPRPEVFIEPLIPSHRVRPTPIDIPSVTISDYIYKTAHPLALGVKKSQSGEM